MSLPYALVFDVGTSSLKLVLYGENGEVLESERVSYDYETPKPRWAEIDPGVWLNALWQGLTNLKARSDLGMVKAISCTGQMHTAVLLDENNEALSPSILWLDRRSDIETKELTDKFALPPYMLNSTYSLPKIAWLRKNRPEILEKAKKIIWPKDYLRFALTGKIATDRTESMGAALLDWETEDWAYDRLEAINCSKEILPCVLPPDGEAGSIKPELVEKFGFSKDVQILTGFGDVVALLGGAPHKRGRLVYSLGSSSMFFTMVDEPKKTSAGNGLYTLNLGGYNLFGGVSSTTGAALVWFHENIWKQGSLEEMIEEAWTVEPGCDGLVYIPYLAGERSPYWSDDIASGFYGVRLQHERKHFARAVLEGVAYSVKHAIDIYRESGVEITEIAMAAGGAKTPGWAQLISDVCNLPVLIYVDTDTVTKVLFALCKGKLTNGRFEEILSESFEEPQTKLHPRSIKEFEKSYAIYRKFSEFANNVNTNNA